MNPSLLRIRAHAVADDRPTDTPRPSPLDILIDTSGPDPLVLALDRPDAIDRHDAAPAARLIDRASCVLIPGLVNAHTHLDLTHIGPQPHNPAEGFPAFARLVMQRRHTDDHAIAASVRDGVERSLRGGVVAVGDIAGAMRLAPFHALRQTPLRAVAYLEAFATGRREHAGIDFITDAAQRLAHLAGRVRPGLSPHAPYSCSPRMYAACARLAHTHALPIATHLAETPEERNFIAHARGPFIDLLRATGAWDESIMHDIGLGRTPLEHLAHALADAPPTALTLAHVNDCSDRDIELLAELGASVAYCPRAAQYFGQHRAFAPHRYADMLRAGINVTLATDSIINLPPHQADRISTIDDARLLADRDAPDPRELLAMITTRGARALAIDESLFRFPNPGRSSPIAGICAVEVDTARAAPPAALVMRSKATPELIAGAGRSGPP